MHTDLARWQFATTSIYYFLFVPVTIGLGVPDRVTADLMAPFRQSRATPAGAVLRRPVADQRGGRRGHRFGAGVRVRDELVGVLAVRRNVFGSPLAMEGLAAFFLESTFLGLWIFGWDRLPKRIHLACIWLVAIGSMLSAAFILAANSWMQHPVGYSINQSTHQPQLNNVLALFTNPTFRWG